VLAAGLAEQRRRPFVTGTAETGADFGIKGQCRRGMGGMTFLAIVPGHRLRVRLMTLPAVRQVTVLGVAIDTGLLAVGIAGLVHIGLGLGMTGDAGGADVGHLRQRLGQGGVRPVTGLAVLQGEVGVRLGGMTFATGQGIAILDRFMPGMTSGAAGLIQVCAPLGLQFLDHRCMAGAAQVGGHFRRVTNRHGIVGIVAGLAVLFPHLVVMGGMAAEALRRVITVRQVALGAIEIIVTIGDAFANGHDTFVTTETGFLDGARLDEIEFQRAVPVMTGSAFLEGIMRFFGGSVALAAVDLGLLTFGRMPQVTFLAGHLRLVLATVPFEFSDYSAMAGGANRLRVLHFRQRLGQGRVGRMAGGAILESEMGPLRRRVTIGTGGDIAVLGMAAGAAEFFVRPPLFDQFRRRPCMAGATQFRRHGFTVSQSGGRMGRMAGQTVLGGHRFTVRLVTFHAGFGFAVPGMTFATTAQARFVLSTAGFKGSHRLFMTDGTGTGGDIGADRRRLRSMGSVTTGALLVAHGRLVRLVAVETGHRLAMPGMTGDTLLLGVGAGGFLHLLPRAGVAADAGFAGILHLGQRLCERRVRVMASGAILDREMGVFLGGVTIGTDRRFAGLRRMIFMTFGTVAHVAMGAAVFLDGADNGAVAAGTGLRRLGQIHLGRLGIVSRMATEAVLLPHLLVVGLMATEALGHLGMDDVTLVAAHFGMGIGAGLLRNRIDMATGADFPGRLQVGEIDIERFVGIMAGSAVGQGIVLRSGGVVTLDAIRVGFAPFQGVAHMAAATADLLVRGSPRGQSLAFVIVAIDAIPRNFPRVRGLRPDPGTGQQQHGKQAG